MSLICYIHMNADHLQPWTISWCESVCICTGIMCSKPQSKQQSHIIGFITDSKYHPLSRRVRSVVFVTRFFGEVFPSMCQHKEGKQRLRQMLLKQQ